LIGNETDSDEIIGSDLGEDLMDFPEGRERFDEEKHPNVEEVEYYKGRAGDEDHDWQDNRDIRNLGLDFDPSPEDDDYTTDRLRPEKKRTISKEEELEKIVLMLNKLDRRIKELEGTEHKALLRRLSKEKELLLQRKKQLSDLPEGF
jgi:hypothetical protein